ncbi:MAG: hypothetical protein LBV59_09870 [Sphingobacterium sp.]|uniref:hypothetical protein n=1 Tax=unclassified Sphingobacterium TaxID=2609468 RepID=UPI0028486163|nr:hypothetical protein [Sphingobacterium sp.]MDR3008229.1 hypothetical protein [Sphingobacterium sp.]
MPECRKVQPAQRPIINFRPYEMKILKEQIFNGMDQALEEQALLQWAELLPFIANGDDDADSCPILAF